MAVFMVSLLVVSLMTGAVSVHHICFLNRMSENRRGTRTRPRSVSFDPTVLFFSRDDEFETIRTRGCRLFFVTILLELVVAALAFWGGGA